MNRTPVALLEANDLILGRVHVTVDEQLAEAPHVTVQRQQFVSDLLRHFPQLDRRGESFCTRLHPPQR